MHVCGVCVFGKLLMRFKRFVVGFLRFFWLVYVWFGGFLCKSAKCSILSGAYVAKRLRERKMRAESMCACVYECLVVLTVGRGQCWHSWETWVGVSSSCPALLIQL